MSYPKRDWDNTGNEVTKDDFKRIEDGVEANDLEIAKQKDSSISGTLANKINDLNGKFTQPTITLYGGWVANDSVPFAVKVGTLLRVYARIKSGATASNTKIANIANISTQFPNQFFTIKDTLTGANLGQAYLTPNGDIYTLIELTANGDYLINESFIVLG